MPLWSRGTSSEALIWPVFPLDLQRRFKQRWAAKFFFRPDKNATKTQELETQEQQQAVSGKGSRKTRRGERVSGLRSGVSAGPTRARAQQKGMYMTDDQVNRIVEHLCEQLHVTIRLKSAQLEVFPPSHAGLFA